jgi:predicted membrane-bound mannosyltransferase
MALSGTFLPKIIHACTNDWPNTTTSKISIGDILNYLIPIGALAAVTILLVGAGSYLYAKFFTNKETSLYGYYFWWGLGALIIIVGISKLIIFLGATLC